MTHTSDVGAVIALATRKKATTNISESYLLGWKPGPEAMPSMQDFNRVYGEGDLLVGGEAIFVSEVASHLDDIRIFGDHAVSYRGTISFEQSDAKKFGIVFFSVLGSFFFVFGYDGPRTVELYYMGVESDAARLCSKLASRFEMDFEDAYFDLRDAAIGKHGIRPGATHE